LECISLVYVAFIILTQKWLKDHCLENSVRGVWIFIQIQIIKEIQGITDELMHSASAYCLHFPAIC
jgi:hypothetical protein